MSGKSFSSESLIHLSDPEVMSQIEVQWKECANSGVLSDTVDIVGGYRIHHGLSVMEDEIFEYAVELKSGEILSNAEFGSIEANHGPHFVSILSQKRRIFPVASKKTNTDLEHNHHGCSLCKKFKTTRKDGTIITHQDRKWDFFFEHEALQTNGQLLIAPDVSENEREQQLYREDCVDLVDMARTMEDLCISFDSVGAGTSVNHIHLNAWVQKELLPVLSFQNSPEYRWEADAIEASVKYSYPAFCVSLQGGSTEQMGKTLFKIVEACQILEIPHNIVARNQELLVFLRKDDFQTEIVHQFTPSINIGASHMAGIWTLDNEEQSKMLTATRIGCALRATRLNWYKGLLLLDRIFGDCIAFTEKENQEVQAKKWKDERKYD